VVVPFSRLVSLNKPELKYGAIGLLGSIGAGCIQPSFAFIMSSFLALFYATAPVRAWTDEHLCRHHDRPLPSSTCFQRSTHDILTFHHHHHHHHRSPSLACAFKCWQCLTCLVVALSTCLSLLLIWAVQLVIAQAQEDMLKEASFWSLMFFTLGCVALISSTVQQYMFGKMGAELARRIRLLMYKSVLHQEVRGEGGGGA
jgi:hypothetical protein